MNSIHPTATIAVSAIVHEGSSIGPYSVVEDDVVIGEGTTIDSHVRVLSGTRIGNRCHLHHGVCIGGTPQSVSFDPSIRTHVEIGDDTVFREFATVHRATTESYTTRIGNRCRFFAYAHVPHDAQIGNDVCLENFVQLAGHTHIDDHSVIRNTLVVHQFTHIGRFCDIRSAVSKDVPPYLSFQRYRLSNEFTLLINENALRSAGCSNEGFVAIRNVYRILYESGLNVSDAAIEIEARMSENEYAQVILSFIKASKRGLITGRVQ